MRWMWTNVQLVHWNPSALFPMPIKWFIITDATQSFFIKSKKFIDLRLMPFPTFGLRHAQCTVHTAAAQQPCLFSLKLLPALERKENQISIAAQSIQFNGQRKSFQKHLQKQKIKMFSVERRLCRRAPMHCYRFGIRMHPDWMVPFSCGSHNLLIVFVVAFVLCYALTIFYCFNWNFCEWVRTSESGHAAERERERTREYCFIFLFLFLFAVYYSFKWIVFSGSCSNWMCLREKMLKSGETTKKNPWKREIRFIYDIVNKYHNVIWMNAGVEMSGCGTTLGSDGRMHLLREYSNTQKSIGRTERRIHLKKNIVRYYFYSKIWMISFAYENKNAKKEKKMISPSNSNPNSNKPNPS